MSTAKEDILNRLRNAPKKLEPQLAAKPDLVVATWSREKQIEKLIEELTAQECTVFRSENKGQALDKLTEFCAEEKLSKLIISDDDIIRAFDLQSWGKTNGIKVMTAAQFENRELFKDAVFDQADAGVTGVDYAIAESGTLALVHSVSQARLISLAPIIHIALIPLDRIVPIYEDVIDKVFADKGHLPSQLTFITGPSLTADIQLTFFRGMHGPKKVITILIDEKFQSQKENAYGV